MARAMALPALAVASSDCAIACLDHVLFLIDRVLWSILVGSADTKQTAVHEFMDYRRVTVIAAITKRRQTKGKMLILVALLMVLISFVFLVGMLFTTLLSQQTSAQYNVDALALSMAKTLNEGDRIGQMNELLGRNRELIFTTRQDYIGCMEQGLGHLSPLCEQLLDEAYSGHAEIEHQRMREIDHVNTEIRKTARIYNERRSNTNRSWFPWLQTFDPEVTRIDLGCMKNVQSNFRSRPAVEELAEHDRKNGYVEPRSNLFRAGINARLPVPDDTLDFKFSALPAFVSGTIAPPRLANPETFVPYPVVMRELDAVSRSNDRMPYVVKISTCMDVALEGEDRGKNSVSITSVGVACGAISDYE